MVARSRDDKGFLSRWSERKRDARQSSEEIAPAEKAAALDAKASEHGPSDTSNAGADEQEFDVNDLPDIDSLDKGSDFSVFMHEKVPDALRRRALRRLWRVDPAFSFLDGMNDYDEDYTDAALVVEGLKTVYQVGKGMLTEDEVEEAKGAEESEGVEDGGAEPEAPVAPAETDCDGSPALGDEARQGEIAMESAVFRQEEEVPAEHVDAPDQAGSEEPREALVPRTRRPCGPIRHGGRSAVSRRWGDSSG